MWNDSALRKLLRCAQGSSKEQNMNMGNRQSFLRLSAHNGGQTMLNLLSFLVIITLFSGLIGFLTFTFQSQGAAICGALRGENVPQVRRFAHHHNVNFVNFDRHRLTPMVTTPPKRAQLRAAA